MGNDQKGKQDNQLLSWVLTIIALCTVWPVGLVLLVKLLTSGSLGIRAKLSPGEPIDVQATEVVDQPAVRQTAQPKAERPRQQSGAAPVQPAQAKSSTRASGQSQPVKKSQAKALLLVGGILALVGVLSLLSDALPELLFSGFSGDLLGDLVFESGLAATGFTLLILGFSRWRKARQYRRYQALIGTQKEVPIDSLAKAMPVSYHQACADLQDMLEQGYLAPGYLDLDSRRIVFSELRPQSRRPAAAPEPTPKKADRSEGILSAIRAVNDDIDDAEMSRKIDRIEEITGKILAFQQQHPERESELRSFLDYYLPTTLKILRTYAKLEDQGVEGKNITATKAEIEAMMDKVVEGFEKQLDKLFQSEAVDITSDMQVLEQMLQRDGLAEDMILKPEA